MARFKGYAILLDSLGDSRSPVLNALGQTERELELGPKSGIPQGVAVQADLSKSGSSSLAAWASGSKSTWTRYNRAILERESSLIEGQDGDYPTLYENRRQKGPKDQERNGGEWKGGPWSDNIAVFHLGGLRDLSAIKLHHYHPTPNKSVLTGLMIVGSRRDSLHSVGIESEQSTRYFSL